MTAEKVEISRESTKDVIDDGIFCFRVLTDENRGLGEIRIRRDSASRDAAESAQPPRLGPRLFAAPEFPEFQVSRCVEPGRRMPRAETACVDYGDDFRKPSIRLFQIAHGEPPQPIAPPPVEFFLTRNIYSRVSCRKTRSMQTCRVARKSLYSGPPPFMRIPVATRVDRVAGALASPVAAAPSRQATAMPLRASFEAGAGTAPLVTSLGFERIKGE
jgi:hypothetical protein